MAESNTQLQRLLAQRGTASVELQAALLLDL
jgi:hypothetical protein